ncbi:hypothetical protein [Streptomyces sp. H27-C3]|uniref:hypothetical protein n=1 Tax=Streptomyces sp. H27-C3 TaxID=3046305 RepID=UPI0024BAEB5E|nr:hypothetical protein [Streptomyces sp. H27-C3]MDJ0464800.1 hypothetical protein [Streptomyces sp. H27-C3]
MGTIDFGLPQASGVGKVLDGLFTFAPDWVRMTVLALVVAGFLAVWSVKLKRKTEYRRAVRSGQPIHAAAQYGQGRGADHLGSYAPGDGDRA